MSARPHRRGGAPTARTPGNRGCCCVEYTCDENPGITALAAEIAALDDEALAEQVTLLALAAQHAALAPLVLLRLRLAATELARRLVAREGVAP